MGGRGLPVGPADRDLLGSLAVPPTLARKHYIARPVASREQAYVCVAQTLHELHHGIRVGGGMSGWNLLYGSSCTIYFELSVLRWQFEKRWNMQTAVLLLLWRSPQVYQDPDSPRLLVGRSGDARHHRERASADGRRRPGEVVAN